MAVTLREKKLSNGQISYYLDIYHDRSRWYEFLDIHINKSRPSEEDKDKKQLALEIRAKREHQLIVEDNGLTNKKQRLSCFIRFAEDILTQKVYNGVFKGTMFNLREFTEHKPLPFARINTDWIKSFEHFLLGRVSNNTAVSYVKVLITLLNTAVRKKMITRNPYMDVPRHERIKKQDIFRSSFDVEQLQHLINTPCNIWPQTKQVYLFSCFSGLRWSDVNCLRWDEIRKRDIGGEVGYYIYFEQQKTGDIEYLPLSDAAADIYLQRKKEAETEEKNPYIFPMIKEDESNPHKSIYCKVSRQLKKWAKAAGIDKELMHFHSSRHSFATNLLENSLSADIYTVSKLLGHKSIIATQIYAKVRDNRKKAAVKDLPKINWSGQSSAA